MAEKVRRPGSAFRGADGHGFVLVADKDGETWGTSNLPKNVKVYQCYFFPRTILSGEYQVVFHWGFQVVRPAFPKSKLMECASLRIKDYMTNDWAV